MAAAAFAACRFSAPAGSGDGGTPDAAAPDAGLCTGPSVTCASDSVLRTCASSGAMAMDTPCAWGCVASGTPHCGKLQPSGGAVTMNDVGPGSGLMDIMLAGATTIDGAGGSIVGPLPVRPAGTGVQNGIGYEVKNGVAVFRFKSLRVMGPVKLIGNQAIALVADGDITVEAIIDARGSGDTAGPGGRDGGAKNVSAVGNGGGSGVVTGKEGAGGGGHGGSGGSGRNIPAGGSAFGNDQISVLQGGGGGGGGGGGMNAGSGGGGGGALQLASNGEIVISATGGINAGGCGGQNGTGGNDGGGGGGAGGAILLEAPRITIAGKLAVNGGGGGGTDTNAGFGSDGRLDSVRAAGAASTKGSGGDGGAGSNIDGERGKQGTADATKYGAGGGAVGRIRFHTRSGSAQVQAGAVLSPALTDSPTRCTQGSADVR